MRDRELMKIWEGIAGARPGIITLVPYKRELVSPAPRMEVYWTYSELVPQTAAEQLPEIYFATISRCEVIRMLRTLSTVNNMLLNQGGSGLHDKLNRDLLGVDRLKEMARQRAEQSDHEPATRIVFHRLSSLLNMKLLLGLQDHGGETANENELAGEIGLLANNFISEESYENNQDLILEGLPIWEINNPRDVGYSMARYHFLIRDYLLGSDAQIVALRGKLKLNVDRFEGLLLDEYLTLIFGLYSLAQEKPGGTINSATVATNLNIPAESVSSFFNGRSLSIEDFRDRFAGRGWAKENFLSLVVSSRFVKDTTQIRKYPFARIDPDTHLVLDSTCVVELLTSGLYWSIFDGLPPRPSRDREHFRELWGRVFELYAVDLLVHFYGKSDSGLSPLRPNLEYRGTDGNGQIDALLDYGNEVILFEMKASLLSLDAKCSGDWNRLQKELVRNFVGNEEGKPKALHQLARAAKAIAEGAVLKGKAPDYIFPVLIVDEKAMECLAMNTYLNELFQDIRDRELVNRIRPITIMSIDELEELLPYIEQQRVSWSELLSSRFRDDEVVITSVHQALYNINSDKNTPLTRNSFLLDRYQEMFESIKKLCPPPPVADANPESQ